MSKIHVMSDTLANKIAAGEVVERISSVVKELVENAIDAKAKNVVVELVDCGTKSIKVTDDGVGMDREDAELAFSRHATSKLLKDDDLLLDAFVEVDNTILLTTNIGVTCASNAFLRTNLVCGIVPSYASTTSNTPSTIFIILSTSPPKSAWPGVSSIFIL